MTEPMPFICLHQDPRCEDDPCPWGIARFLCNAPTDHPLRLSAASNASTDVAETSAPYEPLSSSISNTSKHPDPKETA